MTLEEQREQLFVDYYEEWMTKYKKDVVREVTYIKYKTTLRWLKKLAPYDETINKVRVSEHPEQICSRTRENYSTGLSPYAASVTDRCVR